MSHQWETGFMVRKPSWHRMEKAVLQSSPDNWEDARQEAGLNWEVATEPVYSVDDRGEYDQIEGWQSIYRDDKDWLQEGRVLAIQPTSYEVIKNAEFGAVIDDVLGITKDTDPVNFEALFSLYGGRMVVALCFFEEPLNLSFDPGKTYRYLGCISRHDGSGGLRLIPTNVRIQCANTMNHAEMTDGKRLGITIRHTANWKDRIEAVRAGLGQANKDTEKWVQFAEELALYKVSNRTRDAYLKKFLPISDDMGNRQMTNIENSRDKIRMILSGDTCAGIANTGYGLLMASTEWADHYRDYRTTDSYIGRQLLNKQEPKSRAASVLRSMARLRG